MFKHFFNRKKLHLNVSVKVISTILTLLIILNFSMLVGYMGYSQREERLATSDEIITHVFNTLYLLHISPKNERDRIATVSQTRELGVALTDVPLWPLQMKDDSLEEIAHTLSKMPDDLAVSIRLDDGKWLNVNYDANVDAQLWQIFILILGAVVALALFFSAWSFVRFSEPLKKFKRAAEQLGVELRAEPLIEYGPSIVRETADAMNQMQRRIRHLLDDRNRMLAAISHDLRTPITRMKLRAQFMADQENYRETSVDLDEMEAMIDQILIYTKDAASYGEAVDLDLVAMLLSLCDEQCEQGYQVECVLKINRAPFKGIPLALKRAFTNLLNNAVKYAKHVWVTVDQTEKQWVITLEDDGPGIPDELLEKVFTAFYRVDIARSSMTGGSGLGLSIVQDVIHGHEGSIQLANRDEGGLLVKVLLNKT